MAKKRDYVRDGAGKFAKAAQAKENAEKKRTKPKINQLGKVVRNTSSTNGMFTTGPNVDRRKRPGAIQRSLKVPVLKKRMIKKDS